MDDDKTIPVVPFVLTVVAIVALVLSWRTFQQPCYRSISNMKSDGSARMQIVNSWSECEEVSAGWREMGALDRNIARVVIPKAEKIDQEVRRQKLMTFAFAGGGVSAAIFALVAWFADRCAEAQYKTQSGDPPGKQDNHD